MSYVSLRYFFKLSIFCLRHLFSTNRNHYLYVYPIIYIIYFYAVLAACFFLKMISLDPDCEVGERFGIYCMELRPNLTFAQAQQACAKDGFEVWDSKQRYFLSISNFKTMEKLSILKASNGISFFNLRC